MHCEFRRSLVVLFIVACVFGVSVGVAEAVDGQVMINQSRALAGGVTPGDAPGFPVTISEPGSYKLSGNLTVPDVNTTAVRITADNVTLDLNGFGIFGPWVSGGPGSGNGVQANGWRGVAVMNGSMRGMGGDGVLLGQDGRVERVMAINNGVGGIVVDAGSTVTGSTANLNGYYGIFASAHSTITGNTVRANDIGIEADLGSTVLGNTISNNTSLGLSLFGTGGYAHNVLTNNNGGDTNSQVSGGIQMGGNVCGAALCP